jgi:bifunctional DNA-binding transcriptional regulator/antitoxin component of YhaV-PrlF toxin-antitoxin module
MAVKYKNPGRVEFDAVLKAHEGGGAFVEFPHNVLELYGVKGRIPVKATFDGIPYRGSMVKMGLERHLLLILKEIRERLGKGPGDKMHVMVDLDDKPRVVELKSDMESAYKKAGVLAKYRAMSYSHQREWTLWVEDAKQAETRKRRIEKSIDELRKTALKKDKQKP